ncbi:bifunctional Ribosomal protein L7-L12 [Babesia duncani]|uniref:Bifunctional Ribosomal protein L7-L12 n=1 Tax=Babesia duncani TaxID=323732 RepID=A0AAD9PIT8_9APIC|nr:bifunctional Ribosomal protein L7-L12 [Babesia duncani]
MFQRTFTTSTQRYINTRKHYISTRHYSNGSIDIFKRLKDGGANANSEETRKPSDRVIKLADEILNLTLLESADLCDLCHQRLAGNAMSEYQLGPRTPFPHPQGFFAPNMPPMMGIPNMPVPPAATAQPSNTGAPATTAQSSTASSAPPQAEKEPSVVKLVGFDAAKKIGVIKTIRTITGLGLRESKELVEGFPRVVISDVGGEKAKEIAKQIQQAGGEVKLE